MESGLGSGGNDGGWNSDALGGKHYFLFDGACGAPFYNSYLGKYVYVHYRLLGPNKAEFGITTCTDMSLQNWDTPVKFHDYAGGVQWYGMVIDDSLDNNIIGKTFRFYAASNDVEEKTRYNVMTFTKGSAKVAPPESVGR